MNTLASTRCLVVASAALLMLVAGCSPDPNDRDSELATRVDCSPSSESDILLSVDSGSGKHQNDQDLTVSGQASQTQGLTIRQVVVQGILAGNDGFNYSTWSAIVPIATLKAKADDEGRVTLDVSAKDACGSTKKDRVDVLLVEPASARE